MLRWAPAHTAIAVGDSIALLAVLAAVNVFTVQLSASRLPGVIARSAGQPWELFFSYSSALTLLGLSAFRPHAAWLVAAIAGRRSWRSRCSQSAYSRRWSGCSAGPTQAVPPEGTSRGLFRWHG